MNNDFPKPQPAPPEKPTPPVAAHGSAMSVECLMPCADYPQYKRGDIETKPTADFLAYAQKSTCFHVFPTK